MYTCDTDIEVQILANNLSLENVNQLVLVAEANPDVQVPLINYRTIQEDIA